MRVHHFFPRTKNIGDHFVQRGIEVMLQRIDPDVSITLFDVNDRGSDRLDYGLTLRAIERANDEADLVVVGGSNLYEGNYRWHWGIHLEKDALQHLRVPLLLLGIGSGSGFGAPLHQASARAISEIRLLNDYARLSGARDVVTLEWLHQMGVSKAILTGDPATFIFNRRVKQTPPNRVLIVIPPRRFWSSLHQFRKVWRHGRPMFRALVSLAEFLKQSGKDVVIACNDPHDLPLAQTLFGETGNIVLPQTPEEYFALVADSSAVITGRLHTAVIALSLGTPFVLWNVDQRTEGFIRTYDLASWAISPSSTEIEQRLHKLVTKLLSNDRESVWERPISLRDELNASATASIVKALS